MCYHGAGQMTQKLGTRTVLTKHPSPQNPCLGGSYQPIAPVRGRSNGSELLKYLYTWAQIHTETHMQTHKKRSKSLVNFKHHFSFLNNNYLKIL